MTVMSHYGHRTMETRQSNSGIFWILGGVLTLLLLGCTLTVAASLFIMRSESSFAAPRVAVEATGAQAQPVALQAPPPPLVVVATPEAGMDYESASLRNVYLQVNPAVVNVNVLGSGSSLSSLFSDSGTPHGLSPDSLYSFSSGSGFVWDTDGHIVTNNHVVEGADEVQITFWDQRVAIARVVGTDVDSDLAVLKIEPDGYTLTPIRRGNLEDVYVGMRVAAIGNPFGLNGTLTAGIVSALGRSIPARTSFSIPDAIQTDAPINPGNSGGPLLNEKGELIGVNAQIRSEDRANSGVGFAIPISVVERVIPGLIENGRYDHAYIGISATTFSPVCADVFGLAPDARGAVVLDVIPRTPAARAGIRGAVNNVQTKYPDICPGRAGGDLITAINEQPVTSFDDVLVYLQRYTSPGTEITLSIVRDGAPRDVSVTLTSRPTR